MNRVGGIIFLKVDGQQYKVKGSWSYNLGEDKKEAVVGMDGVHGFKVTPQVGFVEGTITDRGDLSVEALLRTEDATITLELANGKVISFAEAYFAGDGNITTEEGEIEARFESIKKPQEIR